MSQKPPGFEKPKQGFTIATTSIAANKEIASFLPKINTGQQFNKLSVWPESTINSDRMSIQDTSIMNACRNTTDSRIQLNDDTTGRSMIQNNTIDEFNSHIIKSQRSQISSPIQDLERSKATNNEVTKKQKPVSKIAESVVKKRTSKPQVAQAIFEFKVTGMSCVNCSNSLENAMHDAFDDQGMLSVLIAILTHKMKITFKHELFLNKQITPKMIEDKVKAKGFTGELLNIIEVKNQTRSKSFRQSSVKNVLNKQQLNNGSKSQQESSESIESDSQPSIDKSIVDDEESGRHNDEQNNDIITNMGIQSQSKNRTATISIKQPCLSQDSVQKLQELLDQNQSIIHCAIDKKKSEVNVIFRSAETSLRAVIESIQELRIAQDVEYLPNKDKGDIREILNQEVIHYRNRFLISLFIQVPILLLTWLIPYSNPEFLTDYQVVNGSTLYVFMMLILSSVIQFGVGLPFYKGAWKSLKNRSANMDVLVVLGTTAAWTYGLITIFIGYGYDDYDDQLLQDNQAYRMAIHEHVHNFEISSTLITVILLGKLLESFSKKQTVDKLSNLASLSVSKAEFLTDIKSEEDLSLNSPSKDIDVDLLDIGDYVRVTIGNSIPIDGVVVLGNCTCNESMLTGESRPVVKEYGQKVYGGTLLIRGTIIIKVTKLPEDAAVNQIIKLVENAQSSQAPIQAYADKISSRFVPTIVLLAVLSWIVWFSVVYATTDVITLDQNESKFVFAFNFGVSTLVIACPCALGLATPTAVMVGTGIAASLGVLIKGGEILQKMNSITMVIFDKTGTLTAGQPQVKDIVMLKKKFKVAEAIFDEEYLLTLAYLCEKSSEHPLAKSICKKIESKIPQERLSKINDQFIVKSFKNKSGEGVIATVIQKADLENVDEQEDKTLRILCGNDKLMDSQNINLDYGRGLLQMNLESLEQEGRTVVILVLDDIPQMVITLEEKHLTKIEAKETINFLRDKKKLKIGMITGDNQYTADKVAKYLGIQSEDVKARAYPGDKKKTVKAYQAKGEKVLFIGDGVNDGPVLAQADVGMAINTSSDITVNAADIVFMKDNLFDILNAFLISQSTFKRIKYNFCWAFLYNIILIPIAMGCLYPAGGIRLDPMWAGIAMALSSVSVVCSSLLLKCFKPFKQNNKIIVEN